MIVYHVVRFYPGSLTDYDILSTHDSLSAATAALCRMISPGIALVGPVPHYTS